MANDESKDARHSDHVGVGSRAVEGSLAGGFGAVIASMKTGPQVSGGHAIEDSVDDAESAGLCEAVTTFGTGRPRRCRRLVEDESGVCELHQPKKAETSSPSPPDENELRFAELETRIAALEAMLATPAGRGRAR